MFIGIKEMENSLVGSLFAIPFYGCRLFHRAYGVFGLEIGIAQTFYLWNLCQFLYQCSFDFARIIGKAGDLNHAVFINAQIFLVYKA